MTVLVVLTERLDDVEIAVGSVSIYGRYSSQSTTISFHQFVL